MWQEMVKDSGARLIKCRRLALSVSKARLEPEMVEAVHRADLDAARLVVARQLQRHDGAGAALAPRPCGRRRRACATVSPLTPTIVSPARTPACSAGPPGVTRATTSSPRTSFAATPSQGRPGPETRPAARRSPRMGCRPSVGTNMLPGVPPAAGVADDQRADADEPAVAVDQGGAAPGRMRRRREQRLSDEVLPAAGEFALGDDARRQRPSSAPPALATSTGSASFTSAERPNAIGATFSGTSPRRSPKPVSWS